MNQLRDFVAQLDLSALSQSPLGVFAGLLGVVAMAFIANMIARTFIAGMINRILTSSESKRDDVLVRRGVFNRMSQFAPAIVIYATAPLVLSDYPQIAGFVEACSLIYMIAIAVLFIDALINAGLEIYRTFPVSRDYPIKSFAQVAKLIVYFLAFITTMSVILGESPVTFLAGLGALTAVIMLVFKDPILGFVAGIQLSANRMVAVGDWIEMPKFGIDGDVIEIAMTTVKIRNFDKTITTVPTHSLISESFKNWRGMKETGGRRIKRSINIDVGSIRFCDSEMLKRYSNIQYIADYIAKKESELSKHNADIDESSLVNGRHLTNVGTFRAYIEAYLSNHPMISKSLTLLVRQLQPTEHGLPIEVYVFSLDTNWIAYEKIQADIFDHILAAASEFDLKIFQSPSGGDVSLLAARSA